MQELYAIDRISMASKGSTAAFALKAEVIELIKTFSTRTVIKLQYSLPQHYWLQKQRIKN